MEIKALISDSSSEARKNITRSLKQIGVRDIVEATNGNEAVKLMENGNFDIVFAESNTKIGQGEELVNSFRRTDAKLPLIVTAPHSKQIDELKKTYPTAFLTFRDEHFCRGKLRVARLADFSIDVKQL